MESCNWPRNSARIWSFCCSKILWNGHASMTLEVCHYIRDVHYYGQKYICIKFRWIFVQSLLDSRHLFEASFRRLNGRWFVNIHEHVLCDRLLPFYARPKQKEYKILSKRDFGDRKVTVKNTKRNFTASKTRNTAGLRVFLKRRIFSQFSKSTSLQTVSTQILHDQNQRTSAELIILVFPYSQPQDQQQAHLSIVHHVHPLQQQVSASCLRNGDMHGLLCKRRGNWCSCATPKAQEWQEQQVH